MASYFKHVIGYGICRLAPHMALASGAVQQPASSWGVFLPTSCTPRPASSISASPAFTCTCSPLTLSAINRVTLRILLVNSKSQHHVLLMSNISNSKLKKIMSKLDVKILGIIYLGLTYCISVLTLHRLFSSLSFTKLTNSLGYKTCWSCSYGNFKL